MWGRDRYGKGVKSRFRRRRPVAWFLSSGAQEGRTTNEIRKLLANQQARRSFYCGLLHMSCSLRVQRRSAAFGITPRSIEPIWLIGSENRDSGFEVSLESWNRK